MQGQLSLCLFGLGRGLSFLTLEAEKLGEGILTRKANKRATSEEPSLFLLMAWAVLCEKQPSGGGMPWP